MVPQDVQRDSRKERQFTRLSASLPIERPESQKNEAEEKQKFSYDPLYTREENEETYQSKQGRNSQE
ncbi:hypothetical protein ccbrp13_02910 [Ktedonobacteria bacterium brp13]|nr:hypothetical protein ccbrp13_02910 [Ktedonobacteria bacterium brp13]